MKISLCIISGEIAGNEENLVDGGKEKETHKVS